MGKIQKRIQSEKGVGLLEAAILIALISIAVVSTVESLGDSLSDNLDAIPEDIAGGESLTTIREGGANRPHGGGGGILAPLHLDVGTSFLEALQVWIGYMGLMSAGEEFDPNWITVVEDAMLEAEATNDFERNFQDRIRQSREERNSYY